MSYNYQVENNKVHLFLFLPQTTFLGYHYHLQINVSVKNKCTYNADVCNKA
jgi:hypothetical protein